MAGIVKVLAFSEGIDTGPPVETLIGSGGGMGSGHWQSNSNSPIETIVDGKNINTFDKVSSQETYRTIKVPSGYSVGTQIFLTDGQFYTTAITGKVKFKTLATLERAGVTVIGTYPNQHNSVNVGVTVNGVANTKTSIGDIDLTDSSGQINGVDPQAGDDIVVKFFRDCANESPQADADASINMDGFNLEF